MSSATAKLPDEPESEDEGCNPAAFNDVERRLLDEFQRDFPLVPRPYAEIGEPLGLREDAVLGRFEKLKAAKAISRIGAIVAPQRVGWSTLAAMAVPSDRLDEVAELVSGFEAVNHNYEREHRFNLWFVVTGRDQAEVADVLAQIETASGLQVLDLPLVESYRLDLGFPLQWT